MTRYQELSKLSVEHSERFYAMRDECMTFATKLMRQLADYLQCPEEGLAYIEILPTLRFGDRQASVKQSSPTMIYGKDGFWYFGVQFFFDAPDPTYYGIQNSLFGLKKRGDLFVLRHEKDTQLYPEDEGAIREFCESIFQDIKAYYETPVSDPSKRVGFIVPD
ncbi:MAG: hypothetical protein WBD99_02565 [Thermodesulfobacteriota bacterium]